MLGGKRDGKNDASKDEDKDEDENEVYYPLALVLEYFPGGDLKHALYESNLEQTPKSMSIEQKIQIVVGLAAGMAYLHSLPPPIIHRDLKPENVMITQKDGILCPKVIDFGEVVRARKEAVRSVGTLFLFFFFFFGDMYVPCIFHNNFMTS